MLPGNVKYQNAGPRCQPELRRQVDRLLAALVPWRCVLCREPAAGMDLCIDCLNDLPWQGPACRQCALPLADSRQCFCGRCATAVAPQDSCIAALRYALPIKHMIKGLKYNQQLHLARVLGELLAIRIHELRTTGLGTLPDLILPVPLHPRRLFARGFNQSAELALWVGRAHGLTISEQLVKRDRNTPGQAGLTRAARLGNVRGAFSLRADVGGMRLALLDDVITTGSTITELAHLLKNGGAAEVQVWAVARSDT